MRLNSIKPSRGSRAEGKRVGRGVGSGLGKTGGRGHKGQRSRSGGYHKVGFEGGQMPLQRRLPKFGFRSRSARFCAELRLHELTKAGTEIVDMAALKATNLVPQHVKRVKVIASGKIEAPVTVRGIAVTKGARAAIEAAGGKVED
ncbi:MAG: 50S ribosomal protein L15 [Gammaproteobacteria bacterium]|nr:50S ribosomal protein L15 [Gammaproteobacteria bacterium]NIR98759.1 50S ribosomal protein L15 [Gammaproteobacteria bacterium]NIT64469.1 50S ribosomal protein L15 [Gammaproteobacteria bacterium]NIV21389.1 50S ribosomal protein L15 [Gammaproteobacteria bacterium]NIX11259.1 50S ribosomal protein L15 [Gammaproteobacteria bacterium]